MKKLKKFKKLRWHEITLLALILAQVTLFILKTVEIITWSWWFICSPLILSAVCGIVFVVVIAILFSVVEDAEDMKEKIFQIVWLLVVTVVAVVLCFTFFSWKLFIVLLLWKWASSISDSLFKRL